MEIKKGIFIIGSTLWIEKDKVLIMNDLHLGYEGELRSKGVLVPKVQYKDIIKEIEIILKKVTPKTIIINGDLKHEFGRISNQEWREVLDFLDFLLFREVFKLAIIFGLGFIRGSISISNSSISSSETCLFGLHSNMDNEIELLPYIRFILVFSDNIVNRFLRCASKYFFLSSIL